MGGGGSRNQPRPRSELFSHLLNFHAQTWRTNDHSAERGKHPAVSRHHPTQFIHVCAKCTGPCLKPSGIVVHPSIPKSQLCVSAPSSSHTLLSPTFTEDTLRVSQTIVLQYADSHFDICLNRQVPQRSRVAKYQNLAWSHSTATANILKCFHDKIASSRTRPPCC